MRNIFAIALIFIITSICAYMGYEVVRMDRLVNAGASMSRSAQKYDKKISDKKEILVLGDSLAYGVGVSGPEKSFAGVLSERYKDKSIKNNAVIGETIGSLRTTLDKKLTAKYERIYIVVGGNDIMRMHINVFSSKESLKPIIRQASQHADMVILVTTGNFDNVSLSPWALKSFFDIRANIIRSSALELESEIKNFNYIDFQNVMIDRKEYKKLEAADGYHLNDQGIQKLVSVMLEETD